VIDVAALLRSHAAEVAGLIDTLPGMLDGTPERLLESMMYSLRAGGKRIRPALVFEAFAATGCAEPGAREASRAAGLALEMIHTFSLIHDDLPAMDDDDLRRGNPTNHRKFDEPTAILAGDALLAGAFEVVARIPDAVVGRELALELARATGGAGMCGGQMLDIQAENTVVSAEQLARIHRLKTGALFLASVRCGAIAARASAGVRGALDSFGVHIGQAFQIVDDILDETSTAEQMGKATGKDAAGGKNTYPRLFGLARSRELAGSHLDSALTAVAPLGAPSRGLQALARFVIERSF
jgi:geranylgeranyl pyrophosphate synthase